VLLYLSSSESTRLPHSNNNLTRQPHIPRTRTHIDRKLTTRHHPSLPRRIPITQIPSSEIECCGSAGASIQLELVEPSQLLRRHRRGRSGIAQVELGYFCAGNAAGVGDLCGDGCDGRPEVCRATWSLCAGSETGGGCPGDADVAVGEVGVC
jgi:hypothetical protein